MKAEKEHAEAWFHELTRTFPLDAEGTERAFHASWVAVEASDSPRRPAWEAWVRRALQSSRKAESPAGLFIHILEKGPDVDLSAEPELSPVMKRSPYKDMSEELAELRRMYEHIPLMPSLIEGVRIYRNTKHLGWPAAKAALEEYYYHAVAERDQCDSTPSGSATDADTSWLEI